VKRLEKDLRAVDEFLTKDKWTVGASARDASGRACWARDAEAVCWCASGALQTVVRSKGQRRKRALSAWTAQTPNGSVPLLNDGPDGFRRVKAALRRAIKAAS
jgi:hypothetical protein